MTEREFKEIVSRFERAGLEVAVYPHIWQINVTDIDGIVQSYYASTGTACFRSSNDDWWKVKRKTVKDMPEERFRNYCLSGEPLMNFKRGDW